MFLINLEKIPNQMFSLQLEGASYRVSLRTIQGLTYMSVWADGDVLFQDQLCVPNSFVNPYNYVSRGGKFYFKCLDEEYPVWNKFGDTQKLVFLTAEEVNA